MTKKKIWIFGILIAIILVVIGHFIYRETIIQECGCNTIFEFIDCEENDIQCQMEVKQAAKESEEDCKRENVSCSFLFNCKC